MPNLPGQVLVGRPNELGPGPGLPVSAGVASLVGSTVPRQIERIYVGMADGTPRLVWSRMAQPPVGAARTYVAGGQVIITWTVGTPIEADAYDVRRPDGSLVGTLVWGGVGTFVGTMTDTAPRPLSGSYTVTARLGSAIAPPTAAPSLDLSVSVSSLNMNLSDPATPVVVWANPAYGRPTAFNVYRLVGSSLVFQAQVPGTITSWTDNFPNRGASNTYYVAPVLPGGQGTTANTSADVPPNTVTNLALTRSWNPSFPGFSTVHAQWTVPAGVHDSYEYQYEINGVWQTSGGGYNASWPGFLDHADMPDTDPPDVVRFRIRTWANAVALWSAFVTVGPV